MVVVRGARLLGAPGAAVAAALAVATAGVAATATLSSRDGLPDIDDLQGATRFARTVAVALVTGLDYKLALAGTERPSPTYKAALRTANGRAARRLLRLCDTHGGIYTKMGQYIGTMNHVLPEEFTTTLAPLTDRARGMTPEQAELVIKAEMEVLRRRASARGGNNDDNMGDRNNNNDHHDESGHETVRGCADKQTSPPPEHIFIDPEPLAAASIAQVHRGRLADGTPVAVKLQYPWLERQVRGDLASLRVVSSLLNWLHPGLGYEWLLEEFSANLLLELDFLQEAANGIRVGHMFRHDPAVLVPAVHWSLCTSRMLTMEFVDGLRVDDTTSLEAARIASTDVTRTISRVFADMIHVHGLVHCDPHKGNLMVLPNEANQSDRMRKSQHSFRNNDNDDDRTSSSNRSNNNSSKSNTNRHSNSKSAHRGFRLVLLDHGMYRRLDRGFRTAYSELWEAMLTGNAAAGVSAIRGMGISETVAPATLSFDILSLLFTYRTTGTTTTTGTTDNKQQTTRLGARMSKEERRETRKRFATVQASDVHEFLEGLPRDILFVMRTMSIVRSLNLQLGGTSRERFQAMGDAAVRGIQISAGSSWPANSEEPPWFRLQGSRVPADALELLDGAQSKSGGAASSINRAVDSELIEHEMAAMGAVQRWWRAAALESTVGLSVLRMRLKLYAVDVAMAITAARAKPSSGS